MSDVGRRSVLRLVQVHKGRMKDYDHEIDIAQIPKQLDERLALLENIRKTFTDSIPNHHGDILILWCPSGLT